MGPEWTEDDEAKEHKPVDAEMEKLEVDGKTSTGDGGDEEGEQADAETDAGSGRGPRIPTAAAPELEFEPATLPPLAMLGSRRS